MRTLRCWRHCTCDSALLTALTGDIANHLSMLTDPENRGVLDVCIVCGDGLKVLPDAITAIWPKRRSKRVWSIWFTTVCATHPGGIGRRSPKTSNRFTTVRRSRLLNPNSRCSPPSRRSGTRSVSLEKCTIWPARSRPAMTAYTKIKTVSLNTTHLVVRKKPHVRSVVHCGVSIREAR